MNALAYCNAIVVNLEVVGSAQGIIFAKQFGM
jgi:hypothetical protein